MNVTNKDLDNFTKKELLGLPHRKWDDDSNLYDSIMIVPTNKKHDSGYCMIAIIGCMGRTPTEICTLCSDDIEWILPEPRVIAGYIKIGQIRMDAPYKSKVSRFWTDGYKFKVGIAISSIRVELIKP